MNPEQQTVANWVVNAVQLGVLGLVAYFARNSFEDFKTTLAALSAKFDSIASTVSRAEGDRRVSDTKLEALTERVNKLERLIEDLSEGRIT